jgi:hypothetical protein
MGYFRNPKSQKKISNNSIDGFLSDKNRSLDIRERFEQSYRPEPRKIDSSSRLDKISKAEEGFHPNNNQENTQILGSPQKYQPKEYFEDNVEPKTKRRKWLFRKGFGKRLFKGLAVAFIAMILGVSSIFAYGFIKTKGIFHGDGEGAAALQKNVDPTRLNGEGDGRINILLLGKGGEGHTAPDLTDTLLIASIDPIQNEAALLSIPRDLYVKDKSGAGTKINAIYANAKNTVLGSRKVTNELKESAEKAGLEAIENSIKELPGRYGVLLIPSKGNKCISSLLFRFLTFSLYSLMIVFETGILKSTDSDFALSAGKVRSITRLSSSIPLRKELSLSFGSC